MSFESRGLGYGKWREQEKGQGLKGLGPRVVVHLEQALRFYKRHISVELRTRIKGSRLMGRALLVSQIEQSSLVFRGLKLL